MASQRGSQRSSQPCPPASDGRPSTRGGSYPFNTTSDIGDSEFHKGQAVWVLGPEGSQRAAEYVGEGETSAWFGGPPTAIVVYPDTRTGEAVEVDRLIPREPDRG